jgi:type II secretory pathway component PulF
MSWLKLARRIGGIVLFASGVFSLLLPIVPGWLLIAVGLYLLSIDSPALQRRFIILCIRYPLCDRFHKSARRLFSQESEDNKNK